MGFRKVYTHAAEERFWAKVDIKGEGECWMWRSAVGSNGYGRFNVPILGVEHAHRVSLALSLKRLIIGQFACHHCDNKLCVNPAHLYAGDHASNTRDGVERKQYKGRGSKVLGSLNPEEVRKQKLNRKRRKGLVVGPAGLEPATRPL